MNNLTDPIYDACTDIILVKNKLKTAALAFRETGNEKMFEQLSTLSNRLYEDTKTICEYLNAIDRIQKEL